MLLVLSIDGIRVTVLLELTLDLILFEMLLGLDRERLTESCRFLCATALETFLAKDVTELVRVSFLIRTIVCVHSHLIVKVVHVLVARVQLLCKVDLLASRRYRSDGLLEKDAGCE